MLGIVITTYNRPQYLRQCLESILQAEIPEDSLFILIDDCSNNDETQHLINWFYPKGFPVIRIRNERNMGIKYSLKTGVELAFKLGCSVVTNLDADAIINNLAFSKLLQLNYFEPNLIGTGFHSTTINRNGTERHHILRHKKWYCIKESVGGINMIFTEAVYREYISPTLQANVVGNWDYLTSKNTNGIACLIPSVIEHIGIESSMGHNHEQPDVAHDFKPLSLPQVTLIGVDTNHPELLHQSARKCQEHIEFGDVVLITDVIISNKEEYNAFMVRELHKYVKTPYLLIIQHDGYIINWKAWDKRFLDYDYIGAPWVWYRDGMTVGNGGFSLRTFKLHKLIPEIVKETYPEDHQICRVYRRELEAQGIKFAPEDLAAKFSWEGYGSNLPYTNQFGFHGPKVMKQILTQPPIKKEPKEGYIINQFLGLGDILFIVPLIRKWLSQGHDIIWPIADEYIDIKRHFPDIQFVAKSSFAMDYDNKTSFIHQFRWGRYRVINIRWNTCQVADGSDAMTGKYLMFNENPDLWRELKWMRNIKKEVELAQRLDINGSYELHCCHFGNETDGGKQHRVVSKSGLKIVTMTQLPGYTMLDWSGIIENADIIHAVSSSSLYMFEMLDLKAKEIHLYGRKAGLRDHDFVRPIRTKNYILHP